MLAGCGGGGESATETVTVTESSTTETGDTTPTTESPPSTPAPEELIVQLSDLPSGYSVVSAETGPTSLEDTLDDTTPEQEDVIRQHRIEGYEATFKATEGVAQLSCNVTTYRSPEGAQEVLHIGFDRFDKGYSTGEYEGGQASIDEQIGSETRAYTLEKDGISTFVVVWNHENTNSVCVSADFLSTDPAQTIQIAQAQQARIEAVLGGGGSTTTGGGQVSPSPPTSAEGTRTNPYPVRQNVSLPESEGWKLRVNGSIPNGTKAVMAANQFNDPPKPGRQFFLVNVTMTYTGSGSSSGYEAGTLKAVGRSDVSYEDYEDSCGVVPAELNLSKKVFAGGKVTGNVCFAVKKSDVRSLLVFYEPSFSLDDTEVFFRVR
jgi:hypothetical protein